MLPRWREGAVGSKPAYTAAGVARLYKGSSAARASDVSADRRRRARRDATAIIRGVTPSPDHTGTCTCTAIAQQCREAGRPRKATLALKPRKCLLAFVVTLQDSCVFCVCDVARYHCSTSFTPGPSFTPAAGAASSDTASSSTSAGSRAAISSFPTTSSAL